MSDVQWWNAVTLLPTLARVIKEFEAATRTRVRFVWESSGAVELRIADLESLLRRELRCATVLQAIEHLREAA